jgi:NADH-quinone oxidoreductase subunit A
MLEYLPVLLFVIVALGFGAVTIGLSHIIVPRRVTRAKEMAYECGVDPVGDARGRFSIKFYLVALMFILFDIEVVFLYPWAVSFPELGLYGLIYMTMFVLILFAGYLYQLRKRALEWD